MWKFFTSKRAAGTTVPSPGGNYVALLGTPLEVWGNYVAPFALWTATEPRQLLYHRQEHAAHALDAAGVTFLQWSQCGNWLSFYEFKRQETYEVVLLDINGGVAHRLPATDALLQKLPKISGSKESIQALLQHEKHLSGPMVHDSVLAEELLAK